MTYYAAIVEDAGPQIAIGVWFPDLPGCFSAGDSLEEAMLNAEEAIAAYAEVLRDDGKPLPSPTALSELRKNPAFLADSDGRLLALIRAPAEVADAAQ